MLARSGIVFSHPMGPFFFRFFETLFCHLRWVSFLFLPGVLDFFDTPTAFPFSRKLGTTLE